MGLVPLEPAEAEAEDADPARALRLARVRALSGPARTGGESEERESREQRPGRRGEAATRCHGMGSTRDGRSARTLPDLPRRKASHVSRIPPQMLTMSGSQSSSTGLSHTVRARTMANATCAYAATRNARDPVCITSTPSSALRREASQKLSPGLSA